MRQICTSRKVWLPILLLFTAVFIFACWDRGVSIDFDGNGYLCTVPNDGTAEEVPVSFHGQLRKNVYTGSCDIPGVLQCDDRLPRRREHRGLMPRPSLLRTHAHPQHHP